MTFTESGLTFTFPATWGVRHYDQHTYYRGLSSQGLKAVDFVALSPDGRLWLIEVKNYLPRRTPQGVFTPQPKPVDELIAHWRRKTADTERAIRAIHQFQRRAWLYRRLEALLLRLPWYRFDRVFWTHAFHRLTLPQNTEVVLWLELATNDLSYQHQLEAQLQLHHPHLRLASSSQPPLNAFCVAIH